MWALIEGGEVAETTDTDPAGRFHPSMEWVKYDGRTKVATGWRYDGEAFTRPPGESADERRAEALERIDRAADTARAADRSSGAYLDAEYRVVQDALAEWRARSSADEPVPGAIQAWADAEGIDGATAATQIAEAAAQSDDRLLAIRQIRLAGKAAIRGAADSTDFAALAAQYVEQLAGIDVVDAPADEQPADEQPTDEQPTDDVETDVDTTTTTEEIA